MHRFSRVLIDSSLAAVAGMAAVLLIPVVALAVVVTTTVSLSPNHGQPGAAFTATYTLAPCQTVAGTTVDFYWNGYPPSGGQRLGSAPTDATCTARLSTAAPQALRPGGYIVYGFIALPDGSPANGTLAASVFTIDHPVAQSSAGAAGAASGTSDTGQNGATTAGSSSTASKGSHPATSVTSPFGWLALAAVVIGGLLTVLLALLLILWLAASRRKEKQMDAKAA